MAKVANSGIIHGVLSDKAPPKAVERSVDTKTYANGETVNKKDFTDEEYQALIDAGAIVEESEVDLLAPAKLRKTADRQNDAVNATPSDAPEPDDDPEELNELANKQAAREAEIRKEVENDEDFLRDVANAPPGEQQNAVFQAREAEIEKRLAAEFGESEEEEVPAPSGQPS